VIAVSPHQRYVKRKDNLLISRNLKHFAASGATARLVLTGMLVLGLAFTARAQSDESQNGLEGTWRLEVKVFTDCSGQKTLARPIFKALAAFSKGGTLTLTTAGQLPSVATTALGVWRHTFGHYYTAVSETFLFSSPVVLLPPNTIRLTRAIEIVDDDTFTDTIAQEILDPDGNQIATGCGATTATRFK
jgi:hypothetical protein